MIKLQFKQDEDLSMYIFALSQCSDETALQQIQIPRCISTLDIHGMFHRYSQCQGKFCHFNHLFIVQRGDVAQEARYIHFACPTWHRDGHALFVCDGAVDDTQIRFAHDKRIWRNRPANDAFTQAPTCIDLTSPRSLVIGLALDSPIGGAASSRFLSTPFMSRTP